VHGRRLVGISLGDRARIDVTIVMPCLSQARSLPAGIANAWDALQAMYRKLMPRRGPETRVNRSCATRACGSRGGAAGCNCGFDAPEGC
jgi:hypothetical protein